MFGLVGSDMMKISLLEFYLVMGAIIYMNRLDGKAVGGESLQYILRTRIPLLLRCGRANAFESIDGRILTVTIHHVSVDTEDRHNSFRTLLIIHVPLHVMHRSRNPSARSATHSTHRSAVHITL